MSGRTITSQYVGRNNVCGRRRAVGVRAKSAASLQGRPLRADPVFDEPDDHRVDTVISWMQRHVDQFLETLPGSSEARTALDLVLQARGSQREVA